jgi:hypothetical protein
VFDSISVSIVIRLRAGRRGFDSRQRQRFLFSLPHTSVHWVPGALSLWC